MGDPKTPDEDDAHDVLAAEAFAMPAPDPALHHEEAHDVLAAEEFAMPAPDPTLHHAPVVLPTDLTGVAEARDVLAAEEFAMPAGHAGGGAPPTPPEPWVRAVVWGVVALFVARTLLRLLSRRSRRR
jgi:hypothetical protein